MPKSEGLREEDDQSTLAGDMTVYPWGLLMEREKIVDRTGSLPEWGGFRLRAHECAIRERRPAS
jgi:hypothetical protein